MGKAIYVNSFSHIYYHFKKGVKKIMGKMIKFSYWNPILCMKIDAYTDNKILANLFHKQIFNSENILTVGLPIVNDESDNYEVIDEAFFLKTKRSVMNNNISVIATDMMMMQFEDRMGEMILGNKIKFKKSALLSYIGLREKKLVETYTESAISLVNGIARPKGIDYVILANTFKPSEMMAAKNANGWAAYYNPDTKREFV